MKYKIVKERVYDMDLTLERAVLTGAVCFAALLLLLWVCDAKATTDAEREFCLNNSYDAAQVAENKLRGVTIDKMLSFLSGLKGKVPDGYIESNIMNVEHIYSIEFETAEEAQQLSLVKCLQWHKENSNDGKVWM